MHASKDKMHNKERKSSDFFGRSRYFEEMIINESSGITAGEIYLLHTI